MRSNDVIQAAAQTLPNISASPAQTDIPQRANAPRLASHEDCSDAVELSQAAKQHAAAVDDGSIRGGLVQRVRAEIAGGSYLTDEKIDAVVNKLHSRLFASD